MTIISMESNRLIWSKVRTMVKQRKKNIIASIHTDNMNQTKPHGQ